MSQTHTSLGCSVMEHIPTGGNTTVQWKPLRLQRKPPSAYKLCRETSLARCLFQSQQLIINELAPVVVKGAIDVLNFTSLLLWICHWSGWMLGSGLSWEPYKARLTLHCTAGAESLTAEEASSSSSSQAGLHSAQPAGGRECVHLSGPRVRRH